MSVSRLRLADAAIAAALFLFVLFRGLNLASALMPFEGWDEYAHLAVAAYVDEQGHMPSPNEVVPRSLWAFIRAHPHPDGSAAHNVGLGAQTYYVWPTTPLVPLADPHPNRLYQAQHGPLFYHALTILKQGFGIESPAVWADAGRIANVACAATTVSLWFFIFRRFSPEHLSSGFAACAAVVVGSNSLFLYNAARVSNDALALLLASGAVLVYAECFRRPRDIGQARSCVEAAILGVLIGGAVLAKTTVLSVAPVLAIGVFFCVRKRHHAFALALLAAGCVVVGYFAATGAYHLHNLRVTGGLFGMQEAVHNRELGRSMADILAARSQLDAAQVRDILWYGLLHVGGWSGLRDPDALTQVFRLMLYGGVLAFLVAIYSAHRRPAIGRQLAAAWELPALYVLVLGAQMYHVLQSQTAWGVPTTGAWYGLLGLPCLLWFMLLGPAFLGRRTLVAFAAFWTIVFTVAFYWGVFGEQIPFQSHGLASGLRMGLHEGHAHHAILRWPAALSVIAELALQAGVLGWAAGRPLLQGE